MWEPLPLIMYGYAVHPLTPSRRDTRYSSKTRDRLSIVTEASGEEHFIHRDVVSLEVGDEVYAFEKYTPRGKDHVEGIWYRGYVVCTTRRPQVAWNLEVSASKAPPKSEEPQQVFIGIFPASHIYVRDEVSDAEGRLPLNGSTVLTQTNGGGIDITPAWNKDKLGMDTLKEEEEDIDKYSTSASRKSFRLGPAPDQASISRGGLPVYSTSIRSSSPADSGIMKPLPPRPSLKSGDDTASGQMQPIIDEIASALREWHSLMFQYLARRDYRLFHIVREHIETLHLGRRQLLAQTLSAEETNNLRRECVTRLVSGNLVQGLDVIVRHPSWGGLVTVNVEGDIDPRSWVSAIRMYSMQNSLAHLNSSLDNSSSYLLSLGPSDLALSVPVPARSRSVFPDISRPTKHIQSLSGDAEVQPSKSTASKFYHVFLDVRAFVASPCAPGETAELIFSLYAKQGTQFITEDFCAVLNHHGVLARNPSSRIRTLFTELTFSDIQDPVYLVCRIVRSGALRSSAGVGSIIPPDNRRSASGRMEAGNSAGGADVVSPSTRALPNNEYSGQFRRPFGCAVLELTQLGKFTNVDKADSSTLREHAMPIYIPTNEISFSMIHQSIINNNTKEFEKSPRAEMLAVSVKVFRGDLATIVREHTQLLQDIPQTLRLGFPDVVFPGDVRNELYIKLWCGDFGTGYSNGGRLSVSNFTRGQMGPSPSNVEVTVEVRDLEGKTIENVISQGSGEPSTTQFHSMVFQRCNEPTYGELIKLQLPLHDGIPQWHLFFTFRNRSNRDRSNGKVTDMLDKPFAFAFLPLFPDKRAFVEDGSHTLILFKADKMTLLSPEIYLHSPSWLVPGQRSEQIVVHPEMQRLAPPVRDTLTIRSSLCSTKFTHNSVLLSLLNWEKIADRELLSTILTKFTFVGEEEIVKFLRDIFDSLFGILVSHNNPGGEMDHLVFNALATVLGIIQDRRFSNFQPVLDVYIAEHFSCAPASSRILQSLNRLLLDPASPETASALRASLKVWHYIIKFVIRSRELQRSREVGMGGGATAEHLENGFRKELRFHLSEVTRMMSTNSPPSIIGTQTIALQHFNSILPELAEVFPHLELVSIVTTFATNTIAVKGKIVIWKLIMFLQIVKGFLFDNAHCRPLLVEAVVSWVKPHFGRYDEYSHTQASDAEAVRDAARLSWLESIRICVTIIAVMLDKLQQFLVDPNIAGNKHSLRKEQDNVECLLSLIPRLLQSSREFQHPEAMKAMERSQAPPTTKSTVPIAFPETYPFPLLAYMSDPLEAGQDGVRSSIFVPGLGETTMVFLVLILSSPTKDILNFLESSLVIEGRERFVDLLSQFFQVAISVIDGECFPKNWLNVNILTHKILVKMMEPVSTLLVNEFIPPRGLETEFDVQLWKSAFHMLLKLLSSDQLVIEEFSAQKRRAVWRLAGDVRGEGSATLLSMWQSLGWEEHPTVNGEPITRYGGYQILLSSLVGQVVHLCLSHHEQLRSNAVQILYSMIVSDYHESGHFDGIENELVTCLDTLFMSGSRGDDISGVFFVGQLRHLFESTDVDDRLTERVSSFLDSVEHFLELLRSVRALPDGDEFADERVIATLRLMNFIRRIGRDEIYIKYVHQLVNMHLQSQNYVEAALTLKLHSDLHQWDLNTFLSPMEELGLPQQSQFHRKETLCLLILDYLGKGKAWENAIDICKELAYQHSEVTFNYGRLSEILRHQATLLEHIVTEQRYYPDYYLVTFHGGFPGAIRDKRFIYRGYEWEKYGAFCERMLNKHPGAQLLKTAGDPPVDIRFGNDQYIQCIAVLPEPNRALPIFNNAEVPAAIRTYYEHSAINLFSSSRQIKKITPDVLEEMWIDKTYYTTEETFPTVLRRSQVVALETVEISPIEHALTEVTQKSKELAALCTRYEGLAKTTQQIPTNTLAMSLNSVVDTPLNTGIPAYRQMFFSPDYVTRNPERTEQVEKLKHAVDEQVRVIDNCLRLHGQLCPPEFAPFHETLDKFFRKNYHDEIIRLGIPGPTVRRTSIKSETTSAVQASLYEPSLGRSMSTSSTARRLIAPLRLGHFRMTPPPESPQSPVSTIFPSNPISSQTPLQRHLAHLARHGINAVSSSPGDNSDSFSGESPRASFVNVGNSINGAGSIQPSGASMVISQTESAASLGSLSGTIKGRFSRLGSLNFGRRGISRTRT